MKVAALDLGTNTFLCLIAEGNKDGITQVYSDLSKVVRLGQDVDKTGELHPEALKRAQQCLEEFKQEIDRHKVDRILASATSAARDARNGEKLFQIGESLGIPIEIIVGEDEARISYLGATAGKVDKSKNTLVVDVGGGSTELIVGKGEKIFFSKSLNIGGVRLTEKYITTQPVLPEERLKMREYIHAQIRPTLPLIQEQGIEQVVAVAGTPTSIVAIEVGGFSEEKVEGFFLTKERLAFWVEEFSKTTIDEKRTKYQLGGRADIIFAGASVLLELITLLGQPGINVSTKGVRYGVALEMLQKQ